jgi:uncharacterized membrane protein YkvA (DUF1232 family)
MKSLEVFKNFFHPVKFIGQLGAVVRKAGTQTTYTGLLLFYAFKRKETPLWAKRIIIGLLGYLLAPVDAIPDLAPLIGYTDDIGLLSFGLVTIAAYIDESVKSSAKEKMNAWFPNLKPADIQAVDKKL